MCNRLSGTAFWPWSDTDSMKHAKMPYEYIPMITVCQQALGVSQLAKLLRLIGKLAWSPYTGNLDGK